MAFGIPLPELLQRIDSKTYTLYKARFGIYPFPNEVLQKQIALLHLSLANAFRAKDTKAFELSDIYLDYREMYKKAAREATEDFKQKEHERQQKEIELRLIASFQQMGASITVVKE